MSHCPGISSKARAPAIGLLLACSVQAQFVEVTTDLEIAGYFRKGMEPTLRVSSHTHSARVVFGTNTWLIDEASQLERNQWMFSGGLIQLHNTANHTNSPATDPRETTRETHPSADGNPGRSRGSSDLMSYTANVNWLAFCSSPALNRLDRRLFPPSDLWKRYVQATEFKDEVVRFNDPLGLPRSLELYATNGQPVCQYRIATFTNFAGWNIPLEFHLVQYDPAGTNTWQVQFTAKGKVKSIRETTRPMVVSEE